MVLLGQGQEPALKHPCLLTSGLCARTCTLCGLEERIFQTYIFRKRSPAESPNTASKKPCASLSGTARCVNGGIFN